MEHFFDVRMYFSSFPQFGGASSASRKCTSYLAFALRYAFVICTVRNIFFMVGDICGLLWLQLQKNPSLLRAVILKILFFHLAHRIMSLQGVNYGTECSTIRQSLQDLREPVYELYCEPFCKNSRFQSKELQFHFSTSASTFSCEPQTNNLHKLYRRLKLFSRRDNKHKPAKDRSNRVFPYKTFRIKEDTNDEIARTRWCVWNTFTRKNRVNPSLFSPLHTHGYDDSYSYFPHTPAGSPTIDLFHSLDSRVEHKSPTTSADVTSVRSES